MKHILIVSALVVFATGALAQTEPRPTPTPDKADDDVVKISTALIQVDVTVTDRKGKVITDLRRDEIEIYENGQKQDISNFSFVSNVRNIEETSREEKKRAPLPPAGPVKPEGVRRTIALVVDDLTLSFESTYYVRQALRKFVDQQMMEGDLVAIIRTGAGIGALQQFTNDRRQLYAAIENVRWNPVGAGGISAFAPLEARPDGSESEEEAEPGERTQEGIEREFNDFRKSVFATGTLGAINYVVRGMAELPGRKSVMLLSDGFRLFNVNAAGMTEQSRILESLRRLVDQANRASVVIYTMDARGLQTVGLTAADDTAGRSAQQLSQAISDRRDELIETQDGLRYLARETGGLSIVNSNDLSGGIRRILDDQSYYLVGYEPDAETFDPKLRRFNRLEVRVTRAGARVRYRSGFFGVPDRQGSTPALSGSQKLMTALTSPFAVNEVSLRLNALFGSSQQGPFIRSLVHIPARDLKMTDKPDGTKEAVFDIIAMGFGSNGAPVEQLAKTFTMSFTPQTYAQAFEKGFVYDFTFPMKKPGAYQLRVAFRDRGSDKVGSANQFVEVPNLKKKRLTVSGVVLENIAFSDYQRRSQGLQDINKSNPLNDTSLRRFRRGSVLNYGFTIFNAKAAAGQQPRLTSQVQLYRDGKPIFEGQQQPVEPRTNRDPGTVSYGATLSLATGMEPGEYVLQITVTDTLAKGKSSTAYQFVQFEVIE